MQRNAGCTCRLPVAIIVSLLFLSAFAPSEAWAGPPFVTDDPEPVEYQHWEIYVASQYSNNNDGKEGTLPHFEVNYGIVPEVQLHLLVPVAYVHPNGGPTAYGLGDIEAGVKYRFVPETETTPQIGTFPIVHLPTGDSDRDLGDGHVTAFLPLWVQKSWGLWTTYGGGGYWINPGEGNEDFWQLGWLVQRKINESLSIGAEIFYFSKDTDEGRDRTGYNFGGIFDLNAGNHILFSFGRDISGDNRFSTYLGYQWTFGPHEEQDK
jgi:hypothetical protein